MEYMQNKIVGVPVGGGGGGSLKGYLLLTNCAALHHLHQKRKGGGRIFPRLIRIAFSAKCFRAKQRLQILHSHSVVYSEYIVLN